MEQVPNLLAKWKKKHYNLYAFLLIPHQPNLTNSPLDRELNLQSSVTDTLHLEHEVVHHSSSIWLVLDLHLG